MVTARKRTNEENGVILHPQSMTITLLWSLVVVEEEYV